MLYLIIAGIWIILCCLSALWFYCAKAQERRLRNMRKGR
jgi:hypothetical protein